MATQGRPLSPDFKRAIVLVKDYFDRTKGDLREQEGSSAERAAHALGVGLATVKRVMADAKRSPAGLIQEESIRRGRPPRVLSDSLQTMIREYVRQANRDGSHITLEMLSEYLKEEGGDPNFSVRTLGRALDRWGFTFGKGTRSQHLKEKDHVVAARHRYLREKRGNRKGDDVMRPEVYLDESYVNKNHSNDFIWYWDEDGPWVQKPTGKGERLIIMHAMTKNGWIPTAKLVLKSTRKTGDYHGQMNHELFSKWFSEQLLPNMPKHSLIIMDNAPYHNVLSPHSAPTASCKKAEIRAWLMKTLYNGFCGSCSTPFIEPETSKFSSQLSAYLLPLRRSAGQACPAYFFTVSGDDGQKFHSNPNARTRLSADSNVPWKYWPLKQARSRNFINRSTRLLVRWA